MKSERGTESGNWLVSGDTGEYFESTLPDIRIPSPWSAWPICAVSWPVAGGCWFVAPETAPIVALVGDVVAFIGTSLAAAYAALLYWLQPPREA